jgi:DNA-directed RNA polymerase specialized sigma24 family protein
MEIAERPKARLTAAQKRQILKLYDKPYTAAEIARELNIPESAVRQALSEMCPLDTIYA